MLRARAGRLERVPPTATGFSARSSPPRATDGRTRRGRWRQRRSREDDERKVEAAEEPVGVGGGSGGSGGGDGDDGDRSDYTPEDEGTARPTVAS